MKKLISLMLLALVCLTFVSCGGNNGAEIKIDTAALTEGLLTGQEYTYKMEQIDEDIALSLYSVEKADVVSVHMYSAGGVSAEEIAVFEAVSPEAADRILKSAKLRIETQVESFTDYVPAEIPKLNNAVVKGKGNYVVVSVSPNYTKAAEVINGFLK